MVVKQKKSGAERRRSSQVARTLPAQIAAAVAAAGKSPPTSPSPDLRGKSLRNQNTPASSTSRQTRGVRRQHKTRILYTHAYSRRRVCSRRWPSQFATDACNSHFFSRWNLSEIYHRFAVFAKKKKKHRTAIARNKVTKARRRKFFGVFCVRLERTMKSEFSGLHYVRGGRFG